MVSVDKSKKEMHYLVGNERKSFKAGDYKTISALIQSVKQFHQMSLISGATATLISLLVTFIFVRYFKSAQQENRTKKIRLRGAEIVDAETLSNAIKSDGLGSPYSLGNISWLLEKTQRHLYLSGDTGVGKSQALMTVMDVIKGRKEKAILLDKNGEFISHYYNPETDYILSPFDERCSNWTPFLEGLNEMDLERMAKSFIPTLDSGGKDDHWPEASITVFAALLYQVSKADGFDGNIDDILTKILETTRQVETDLLGNQKEVVKRGLTELVKGTLASLVIDPDSPEHASSVIASLVPKIRSLRYLRGLEDHPDFSLRDWVSNDEDKGWVFIRVSEDQLDAAGPLVTAWFDTVIKSVLSLGKSEERIIWNIIDELQSLGKVNSLKKALYEGRKHGLRNILGFTSVNELFDIYGENSATAMLAQCNTKMVFQTDEPKAAKWNAELLGMEEVVTENESLNFGKHDSHGASEQRNDKFIVMPSEIQRLPTFHAYLKFSGDWPVTQIKTHYSDREIIAEPFIMREIPAPLIVEQIVIEPDEKPKKSTIPIPTKTKNQKVRIAEPLI